MAILTSGSIAAADKVPAGVQTAFKITNATFLPDGKYGPAIELQLELTDDKYIGSTCRYYASIQQPRLDLVRKYRKDKMSDKLIAEALREKGIKFKKVDEPDSMLIGRYGNTYSILTAVTGSVTGAEEALQSCDNFEELAARLVGGVFVGTTKRSADDAYVRLDGTEEIFPVASSVPTPDAQPMKVAAVGDDEADFDDIPW